jgi:hypothetical protein
MICETCHGTGHVLQQWASTVLAELPCPECNGTGITSCCDGACGGPGDVIGTRLRVQREGDAVIDRFGVVQPTFRVS